MKKSDLIFSIFVLTTATTFAFANAYKWENKDNQVEYSQEPPPNQDATVIAPPPPPASSAPQEQKEIQSIEQKFSKEAQEAAEKKAKQAKEALTKKEMDYNCNLARKHLADMESKARIRLVGPSSALQMSVEQREAEIQKTKEAVEKYCKP